MKTKRLMALVIAVLTLTMAFAPAALAATVYATGNWSTWRTQKTSSYDTYYTYAIQVFLNRHMTGYPTLTADGVFGSQTNNRVRNFQDYHGLQVDGIVGSATWTKMQSYLVDNSSSGGEVMSISTELDSTVEPTVITVEYCVAPISGTMSSTAYFKSLGAKWLYYNSSWCYIYYTE